jgi:outer membrane protein TolC
MPSPLQAGIQLEQAIAIAQQRDPWIEGNEYQQEAIQADSIAAGTLPDPIINAGFANVPTDSFEFNEEPMTQFKVGVLQAFPRGDSRSLREKQLAITGSQYPYQREDRRAKVAVNVTQLWLDEIGANLSIQLIEQDRDLFEHLVDLVQTSYTSAMGKTRQHDLIRAQLELTRLEDRLTLLQERREVAQAKLREWIGPLAAQNADYKVSDNKLISNYHDLLPKLILVNPELYDHGRAPQSQLLATYLASHPAIQDVDAKIEASDTGIALAKQSYKPQWMLNAGYGYRDNSPSGQDRPDFLSVGIAVDIPLFTAKRQDKLVQSAAARSEAVRTERALLLRSMVAAFETQRARLLRLDQRRTLYQSRLLTEMAEQAEAALSAYTSDDGDFAEVVRARIAELNAKLDALEIEVERLKVVSQLNYILTKTSL